MQLRKDANFVEYYKVLKLANFVVDLDIFVSIIVNKSFMVAKKGKVLSNI